MDIDEHIEQVCADAGLGVMVQVYEIIRDRESVPDSTLLDLTTEDVTEHYWSMIGPAIDHVETFMTTPWVECPDCSYRAIDEDDLREHRSLNEDLKEKRARE